MHCIEGIRKYLCNTRHDVEYKLDDRRNDKAGILPLPRDKVVSPEKRFSQHPENFQVFEELTILSYSLEKGN